MSSFILALCVLIYGLADKFIKVLRLDSGSWLVLVVEDDVLARFLSDFVSHGDYCVHAILFLFLRPPKDGLESKFSRCL